MIVFICIQVYTDILVYTKNERFLKTEKIEGTRADEIDFNIKRNDWCNV